MDDFWYDISELWVGTFFYGIYLVLFCICIYILLNRPRNLGNTILLVTAIALFTLATVQTVINLVLGTGEIEDFDIPYDQLGDATDVIYTINNFIADGLVIYRCYVVWSNNVLVTILPILMLIVSTVLGIVESFDFNLSLYPFFAVSLATNVLVTTLTGNWACLVDLSLFSFVLEACRKTTIHICDSHLVRVLVESGMLYSANVLAYMIVISIPSVFILREPIFAMLVQVMCIAPTLIIVRAGLAVKGAEPKPTSDTTSSQQRPFFGERIRQPDLNKDVPALPSDVEKGLSEFPGVI
ncbi:hypothetical protein MSAN_01643800 [Mycena sanguinolenta]|uniref:Uncharacterized protein n=1 Tax=Mycena sanguinolenta TaxID=230812 RepID=A0A8H6XYS9_9AGAR|nr:hypothetical protein MSAN_01643800 [Mycena sanguinolenta]